MNARDRQAGGKTGAGRRHARAGAEEPRIHDWVYALAAFHERMGLAGGDRNGTRTTPSSHEPTPVRPFDDASAK